MKGCVLANGLTLTFWDHPKLSSTLSVNVEITNNTHRIDKVASNEQEDREDDVSRASHDDEGTACSIVHSDCVPKAEDLNMSSHEDMAAKANLGFKEHRHLIVARPVHIGTFLFTMPKDTRLLRR